MGRSLVRRGAFVAVGALFGVALDFAATAAAGYDQGSSGLDIALGFAAGFPLSLVPFLSTIYVLGFTPPLIWIGIGWALARRREGVRDGWCTPALLLMQCVGLALAPIVFGASRSPLFHWSSKAWGGLVLFVVLWLIGMTGALQLLAPPAVARQTARSMPLTRRAVVSRLAVAMMLVLAAGAVLFARSRMEIVCARDTSCTLTRRGWHSETGTWPIEQVRIHRGVPYSMLDVGPASDPHTILRVHCADAITGGNFFNRCESRQGRLLADLELFLQRRTPERLSLGYDDLEGARLIAAALVCIAASMALGTLASLRRGRR